MNKKKVQLAAIVLLAGVLALSVFLSFNKPNAGPQDISQIPESVGAAVSRPVQAVQPLSAIKPKSVKYEVQNLKDPFDYPVNVKSALDGLMRQKEEVKEGPKEPARLPQLKLEGLIWNTSAPQAIINGKILKINDSIGDAKITDISKEGVKLLFDAKEFNLTMPGAALAQKPESDAGR